MSQKLRAAAAATLLLTATFAVLLSAEPQNGLAAYRECSDGYDNDHDGKVDYPDDDECSSVNDDNEDALNGEIALSVTDGKATITPGDSVIYSVTVRQHSDTRRDVDVDLSVPSYITLTSASDGGRLSIHGVSWEEVSVSQNYTRTFTVQGIVNTNAPEGELAVVRVRTDGVQATDTSRVEDAQNLTGQFHLRLTDGKTSVQPAETLHYTLTVTNDTNRTQTVDVRVALPMNLNFNDASGDGTRTTDDDVIWRKMTFTPGEARTFTFSANVTDRTVTDQMIRTVASVGGVRATDETYLDRGLPRTALALSVSDAREEAERGELLTYVVEIRNTSDELGTEEYVTASLPIYSEFVDAAEGGRWDGKNVRWNNIQIAPNGVRRLAFTMRVRSDAPIDNDLLVTAQTAGSLDSDYTTVVKNARAFRGTDPGTSTRFDDDMLLRKVASADEVIPGTTIRYTLYVKNTFDFALNDVTVSDRFDANLLSFVSGDTSRREGNQLIFVVPSLHPGETWSTSYTLRVSENAQKGIDLTNIATIAGPQIDSLSLTERVRTVRTGVITEGLPKTGAAMDFIFVISSMVTMGGALATQQIRRVLA